MKKMLLAIILTLAMALMSAPAMACPVGGCVGSTASANYAGAISLTYNPAAVLTTFDNNPKGGITQDGYSIGGYVNGQRSGSATGQSDQIKILRWTITLPGFATATGSLTGTVTGNGYAFDDFDYGKSGDYSYKSDYAGAGAFTKASGEGWELALAGITCPVTSTSISINGLAGQGDRAEAFSGYSTNHGFGYAIGGNTSEALFNGSASNTGTVLSLSTIDGSSWTSGETRVFGKVEGVTDQWTKSSAWGFTKNEGFGNGGVLGSGNMATQTLAIGNNGSWAGTLTSSSFSYNNPSGYGFGIAGGNGTSYVGRIPGGVTATSSSSSFAVAK